MASSRPRTPPEVASPISVKSGRSNRPLLEPNAARIITSFWRMAPRASIRLATFAHGISKISPTVPNSTSKGLRDSPVSTPITAPKIAVFAPIPRPG